MRMGFIFSHIVPANVERNRAMLMQKCHRLMSGDEKFSLLQSSNVAAASKPTTTGRRPENIDCTIGEFMCFRNILLMSSIKIREGSTSAKVAVILPKTDMVLLMPAL